MAAVVEAREVSKRFWLRHNRTTDLKVRFLAMFHQRHRERAEEYWAVRDVSLRIERGEAIGVIGRNGSGKSTLLRMIAGIYSPTTGQMLVAPGTRLTSMIELGVGFHGELSGRENVYLNASVHGLGRAAIDRLYPVIAEYADLGEFIDEPLKTCSVGMQMRLGFAVAANLDPDVLLLDEVFAVGDAEFQRRCFDTLAGFRERGKTLVVVSHSAEMIRAMCQRVCVLEQGRLVFDGDVDEGLEFYNALTGQPIAEPTLEPAAL